MQKTGNLPSYVHCEAKTATGQLVHITCSPDMANEVKNFLKTHVRSIEAKVTEKISVPKGSFDQYTRYKVTQHDYAGGGPGEEGQWSYIEVLTIKDPPDGRWGIVTYEKTSHSGSVFTEWETLEDARAAFNSIWSNQNTFETFPKLKGFRRYVLCGALIPWFYAIGKEQLIRDYTVPNGLEDDPVYRLGRQFVAFDSNGIPSIKSCMGTRFVERKDIHYPYTVHRYRIVYWDDGSIWNEFSTNSWPKKIKSPRPAEKGELWVSEAISQFLQLLAGRSTQFTIHFTDGNKFVGKFLRHKHRVASPEGDYYTVVHLKDEKEPRQGWIYDFKPTPEVPTIIDLLTKRLNNQGHDIVRIEVTESRTKRNGKKWAGVFFGF